MTIPILILLALVGAMPVLAQPTAERFVSSFAITPRPCSLVCESFSTVPSTGKAQLTETAPHSSRVSLWALTSSH